MSDDRLPTGLWVDTHLRRLNAQGQAYYVTHRGNHASGVVLLKISALDGSCRLLIQQRNFETDKLEWTAALPEEDVLESKADDYIKRAVSRDPDLWVIEIENRNKENPFSE